MMDKQRGYTGKSKNGLREGNKTFVSDAEILDKTNSNGRVC